VQEGENYRKTAEREVDVVMATSYASNLNEVRDELLREYMVATGSEKAEILSRIMELDEELEYANN